MALSVRLVAALLLTAGTASLPSIAQAQSCTVSNADFSVVTYFKKRVPLLGPRCDMAKLSGSPPRCMAELKGFLYMPKAAGKHSAVVWNHGSGQALLKDGVTPDPGADNCELAKFFVDKGYIVFAPQRRGTGMSSGVYHRDVLDRIEADDGPVPADAALGPLLSEQTQDVQSAVDFVRHHARSNGRVALMGHSFGGMVTLFSAAKVSHIKAAVDSAGGALSWNTYPYLRAYLVIQTPLVKIPTLTTVRLNDPRRV